MVMYVLFAVQDWIVYPDKVYELLAVRLFALVMGGINLAILPRISERWLMRYVVMLILLASNTLTVMCALSGEGLASPYYAGQVIVIMMVMVYFPVENHYYLAVVAACLAQHFGILMMMPWTVTDLTINLFNLGAFVACGWFNRLYVVRLLAEIKQLKGIIPICASCKSIRNDKGFWDRIEHYIAANTDARFSHGICPDCAKKLYPDVVE